jgi:hypothetical protein
MFLQKQKKKRMSHRSEKRRITSQPHHADKPGKKKNLIWVQSQLSPPSMGLGGLAESLSPVRCRTQVLIGCELADSVVSMGRGSATRWARKEKKKGTGERSSTPELAIKIRMSPDDFSIVWLHNAIHA